VNHPSHKSYKSHPQHPQQTSHRPQKMKGEPRTTNRQP
jgi:hypothetical protein